MSEFSDFWEAFYPNAEPTGWLMRAANVQHWVRFHSLPLSKRYAETEEEVSILLDRQNELASETLGGNQLCWLVQACWISQDGYVEMTDKSEMFKETREFGLTHAFSFCEDEGGDDATFWNVMTAPVRWIQDGFNDVLLRIANDQAAPTLWASVESGAVFAPYDGGVDIFLPSEAMVEELQSKHADWLSSHPEGL